MPPTEEQIAKAVERLNGAIEKAREELTGDDDHQERVLRFAVYRVAHRELRHHVRDIVWTEPPFPELGDRKP